MNRQPVWLWILIGALALGALLVYLAGRFPESLEGNGALALTRGLFVLGLVGGSLILHRHFRLGTVLRHIVIWVGIGALILMGYSYRFEFARLGDRVMSELVPSAGRSQGLSVQFPVSPGGHFIVEAEVDGIPVRFLVDTGASDVALAPVDAERLGIDLDRLTYDKVYNTANGVIRGAPLTLRRIAVGPVVLTDVRASVSRAPMGRSLLGMSFLGRLNGFEVTDRTLTLRQ